MPLDQARADLAVKFFERLLTHTKGVYARKPFKLPAWQKKIISDLFGTVRKDGRYVDVFDDRGRLVAKRFEAFRQYSRAYIEIPKKNGKTELAAGIANYGLFMDDEPGAEIYSAASSRDQASICHRVAAQMVRQAPDLRDLAKIVDSTKVIYLKNDPSSFHKAISADAGVQDGINPHIVIYDELHRQRTRDLYDVLSFGSDTRAQPLMVCLTTAGVFGESPICEEMHDYALQVLKGTFKDPSFYAVIFGLDPKDEWDFEGEPAKFDRKKRVYSSPTGWYKANPALGDFLSLAKVREVAREAKRIPSKQSTFRRFRLNQWVNQESIWIEHAKWKACGAPFNVSELLHKRCFGGLDLSSTIDITAFVLVFEVDGEFLVVPEFWLPEEDLAERVKRDLVPYDVWAKQGLVRLTEGNVIDYAFVRQRIRELGELYEIAEIGFDPANATQLVLELMGDGFKMVPIRQGFLSLSPPSKELERLIMRQALRHGGHPVLTWMNDCCSVKHDAGDNIKPVKPDRRKSSKRIDGIVALIMALDRANRREDNASIYETRDLLML